MSLPLALASTPAYFACRSDLNSKYLICKYDQSMGGIYMEASAESVVGKARTRFIPEMYDVKQRLVEVRCGYNKKYWAPQQVGTTTPSHWIIGAVNEQDHMDLSKPSSTVFEIVPEGDSIRFYHRGLQKYACIIVDNTRTSLQLRDKESMQRVGDRRSDTFTVIGVSHDKELPKHVVFKGDNGKYLRPHQFVPPGTPSETQQNPRFLQQLPWHLQFGQDDKNDPSAHHTTYTNDEGLVCIKSEETKTFWKHEDDFIQAKSKVANFNDRYTMFKVLSTDNYTALQNMGNNKYCKMFSSYGNHNVGWDIFSGIFGGPRTPFKEDCFSANAETIDEYARLHVEEPLLERKISDVKHHYDEARIYGKTTVINKRTTHQNISYLESIITVGSKTERVTGKKWETSVSMKTTEDIHAISTMGIEIPILNEGKLAFDLDLDRSIRSESNNYQHEEGSETIRKEGRTTQTFHVPAKTELEIEVKDNLYHCDVPFSYRQTDRLPNGKETETTNDDGIYTFTINELLAKVIKITSLPE